MSTTDDNVEALLEQASPRPSPPGEDEQMIREAVFSEWQAVTGQRRTRKRVTRFAIAATVLLGVAVSFNTLQQNGIAAVQVATIAKSHGTIYVQGEESQLHELPDMSSIMSGQIVLTDHDSGIALEWADGGSLRIAENTRIEFSSAEEIYLHSGRIYFDSTPSELLAGTSSADASLRILTKHGTVTHLGTQYMTYFSDSELTVSVREGEVFVDGNYHDGKAKAGQQLSMRGSAKGVVGNFPLHGEAWRWVEDMSPDVDTDGRSVETFLNWVERETGLQVEYPNEITRQAARDDVLSGSVNLGPRAALDFWLETTDLNWNVDGGIIKVSAIDESIGQ